MSFSGWYVLARARGEWLRKHPAHPGNYREGRLLCSEDGCGRPVGRRDSTRSGWTHLPRRTRKGTSR